MKTQRSSKCIITLVLLIAVGQARAAIIVDNSDSGFIVLGGVWDTVLDPSSHGADYRSHPGDAIADRVRFTPDLPLAGTYQVLLTWPDVPTEDTIAADAPFTVNHIGGPQTFTINQKLAPLPDIVSGGSNFQLLGHFSFHAGTGGNVELTGNAGGIVLADAVAFNLVPLPAALPLLASALGLAVRFAGRKKH